MITLQRQLSPSSIPGFFFQIYRHSMKRDDRIKATFFFYDLLDTFSQYQVIVLLAYFKQFWSGLIPLVLSLSLRRNRLMDGTLDKLVTLSMAKFENKNVATKLLTRNFFKVFILISLSPSVLSEKNLAAGAKKFCPKYQNRFRHLMFSFQASKLQL